MEFLENGNNPGDMIEFYATLLPAAVFSVFKRQTGLVSCNFFLYQASGWPCVMWRR
jgi:hypothetical protein